jgi:hypothetical protein
LLRVGCALAARCADCYFLEEEGFSMDDRPAAEQIDDIIKMPGDWRGETLAHLRALIQDADPAVVEDVKWKKPSRPEGAPVWTHDGNVCVADILKNAVRLTFPKGAQLTDRSHLFNTRQDRSRHRLPQK